MASVTISSSASLPIATTMKQSRQAMTDSSIRIASGKNNVTAKDNAAGVATVVRLQSNIAALDSASDNIESAKNFLNTVDGTLAEVVSILTRYQTLASSGVNGSFTDQEFKAIDTEASLLKQELDRLSTSASFNGTTFLNGTFNQAFAVGANLSAALDPGTDDIIVVDLSSFNTSANSLGLVSNLLSSNSAGAASAQVSSALDTVSIFRAQVGAMLSRFEYAGRSNDSAINSLTAAKSSIEDTDYSKETTAFSSQTILVQASNAMLAQANQAASSIIELLR